jgi:hypothetical protein
MTKPTGRPRGRPKTKHYVTLMARVDVALADQVKRYAALHKQPLSVVIRDALALLMDEYPAGAARSGPQRLAVHEFLSDRYEAPLDLLLEGTDSAERDALLSDMNEVDVETILSDMNWGETIASDTKAGSVDIVSDTNMRDRLREPNWRLTLCTARSMPSNVKFRPTHILLQKRRHCPVKAAIK